MIIPFNNGDVLLAANYYQAVMFGSDFGVAMMRARQLNGYRITS
jgi:hypothetical protein